MEHKLPTLNYALDALAPHLSKETMEYHYGKHHLKYCTNLNSLVANNSFKGVMDLHKIILESKQGPIFNNAAQVWNHNFYWFCLTPNSTGSPTGALLEKIQEKWGSFDSFKEEFTKSAVANFGSGWTWLVQTPEGKLDIVSTSNAGTPLSTDNKPLLTCDVWEHAYYIDYRNDRPKYVETFWNLVDWNFVAKNMETEGVWHHGQF